MNTEFDDHIAAVRAKVLATMLPDVPFDGWTLSGLLAAANTAGVDAGMARLAFPDGVTDLLEYFSADADARMEEALHDADMESLKIREKIALAVRTRLEQNEAHREAVRRAVHTLALPIHGTVATRSLYRTVDAMWRAAGDTSTDLNFYSKRAILAALYTSVLMYWLNDESEEHTETWTFLYRRIENVMQFEKFKARLPDISKILEAPFRAMGHLRHSDPFRRPRRRY